jgi:hypothetical protein
MKWYDAQDKETATVVRQAREDFEYELYELEINPPRIRLTGHSNSIGDILFRCREALKDAGYSQQIRDWFAITAMAKGSNYDVINFVMDTFELDDE